MSWGLGAYEDASVPKRAAADPLEDWSPRFLLSWQAGWPACLELAGQDASVPEAAAAAHIGRLESSILAVLAG